MKELPLLIKNKLLFFDFEVLPCLFFSFFGSILSKGPELGQGK